MKPNVVPLLPGMESGMVRRLGRVECVVQRVAHPVKGGMGRVECGMQPLVVKGLKESIDRCMSCLIEIFPKLLMEQVMQELNSLMDSVMNFLMQRGILYEVWAMKERVGGIQGSMQSAIMQPSEDRMENRIHSGVVKFGKFIMEVCMQRAVRVDEVVELTIVEPGMEVGMEGICLGMERGVVGILTSM